MYRLSNMRIEVSDSQHFFKKNIYIFVFVFGKINFICFTRDFQVNRFCETIKIWRYVYKLELYIINKIQSD